MFVQQDDTATVPTQQSLIGSWFMEYSNDTDTYRVEYLFCTDGTGVERIQMKDAAIPDERYLFVWHTEGNRLSVVYTPNMDSQVVMHCCFDDDKCIFEDPERVWDSMVIRRFTEL